MEDRKCEGCANCTRSIGGPGFVEHRGCTAVPMRGGRLVDAMLCGIPACGEAMAEFVPRVGESMVRYEAVSAAA